MAAFVEDELVASLLLVHGLHPESLDNRVEAALASGPAVPGPARRRRGAARHRRRRAAPSSSASSGVATAVPPRPAPCRVPSRWPSSRRRPRSSGSWSKSRRPRPARRARSPWGPSHSPCTTTCPAEMAVSGGDRSARRAAADPREPAARGAAAGEVCELCAEPISDEHGHLVDLQARTLLCACRGCYLLFTSEGAGGAHFRSRPRPLPGLPRLRALRRSSGTACRSRSAWPSSSSTRPWGGSPPSTRARPAPPSRSSRSTPGPR